MLLIEDMLETEKQASSSSGSYTAAASSSKLQESKPIACVKIVSREELLKLDGFELIDSLFEIFLSRPPSATQRGFYYARLAQGTKFEFYRDFYDAIIADKWIGIRGRGWLMEKASADALPLKKFLAFSLRFIWFKMLGR